MHARRRAGSSERIAYEDDMLDSQYDVACPYEGGASYAASLRECYVSATSWYGIGHAVGKTMRDTIQKHLRSSSSIAQLESWAATPAGEAAIRNFQTIHEETYPELMEQVRGIADGA